MIKMQENPLTLKGVSFHSDIVIAGSMKVEILVVAFMQSSKSCSKCVSFQSEFVINLLRRKNILVLIFHICYRQHDDMEGPIKLFCMSWRTIH